MILYRSNIVWSCYTGRDSGCDYLPTGEMYRGWIYFKHIPTIGGMQRLEITLDDGKKVKLGHDQEHAGNDRVRVYPRGRTHDGYTILEVKQLHGDNQRNPSGVRSVAVQAYHRTSDRQYDPLSQAHFGIWESATNGGVIVNGHDSKNIIDAHTDHYWYNELFTQDGELLYMNEHPSDRLIFFTFKCNIAPMPADTSEQYYAWCIQILNDQRELIVSSPVSYSPAGGMLLGVQQNITLYVRADEDPLVEKGIIPKFYNMGGNKVKVQNAEVNLYTIDSPRNPVIDYGWEKPVEGMDAGDLE